MKSSKPDPEAWLAGLDPVGWRFGLERIQVLLEDLRNPQRSFDAVHVVGTNGKSSVTEMIAALAMQAELGTGTYLSPHTSRWAERVKIHGEEIAPDAFARATAAVASAIERVEKRFEKGERITQFEASTAVAFVAMRDARIDLGVIEAGLGGRLDATNVLDSSVTVLTSVGLDHTAYLGETELEIAGEKLAVLRPDTKLVLGAVSSEVEALARETAAERRCKVVEPADGRISRLESEKSFPRGVSAPYLRRNLAVALAAAESVVGTLGDDQVTRALRSLDLHGRFERVGGDPPVVLDAAHNPAGAAALAEAVAQEAGGRPVVACLAILADKDARGILEALRPVLDSAVCTEIPPQRLEGAGRPGTTAVPSADLAGMLQGAGVPATAEPDPAEAVRMTKNLALERGGMALIAGSHYLLGIVE